MDAEVYPEFVEEFVISWYELMGDLGGVIGLWLGASFVGVLHFFEFVIKDVIFNLKWQKMAKKASAQSNGHSNVALDQM